MSEYNEYGEEIVEDGRTQKENQAYYQKLHDNAPRCPVCGTPKGFAMCTGDCNCGEE